MKELVKTINNKINIWINKIPWNKINFSPRDLKNPFVNKYGAHKWDNNKEELIFAYELARMQQTKLMSGFFALSCVFITLLIWIKPSF